MYQVIGVFGGQVYFGDLLSKAFWFVPDVRKETLLQGLRNLVECHNHSDLKSWSLDHRYQMLDGCQLHQSYLSVCALTKNIVAT